MTNHVLYLVLLLTVNEDEAVFAGGATDLDDGASFLFHGEVAEDVELDLLSGGDLDIPGAGGGAGGYAVSDAEGQVTIVRVDIDVAGIHALLAGPVGNYNVQHRKPWLLST